MRTTSGARAASDAMTRDDGRDDDDDDDDDDARATRSSDALCDDETTTRRPTDRPTDQSRVSIITGRDSRSPVVTQDGVPLAPTRAVVRRRARGIRRRARAGTSPDGGSHRW
jgi:hypothetical protein